MANFNVTIDETANKVTVVGDESQVLLVSQGVQGPPGTTDHGALTGLADDDHTQYHNDSRANTWLATKSTTNLSEGTNLYFTDARAKAAAVADAINNGTTDVAPSQNAVFDALALKQPLDTQLTDLAGLSYSGNALKVIRVNAGENGWELATGGGAGLTSINSQTGAAQTLAVGTSGTDFAIVSATDTHTFNLPTASGTNRGALSSADWTTFNNKQNALTIGNLTESTSSVLTITGGTGAIIGAGLTIQVAQASGSTSGYLSSADWTTFNNKLGAAVTSINSLTAASQSLVVGTSGSDFNIDSTTATHTFNIPDAGAAARGLVTTGTQTFAGAKTFSSAPTFSTMTAGSVLFAGTSGLVSQDNANLFWNDTDNNLFIGATSKSSYLNGGGAVVDLFQVHGRASLAFADNSTGYLTIFNKGTNSANIAGIQFASGNNIGNASANYYAIENYTQLGVPGLTLRCKSLGTSTYIPFSISSTTNIGMHIFPAIGTTAMGLGVGLATETTTIGARLHVRGVGSTSATQAAIIENQAGTGILYVRNDVRVGINESSPDNTLHVTCSSSGAAFSLAKFENQDNTGTSGFVIDLVAGSANLSTIAVRRDRLEFGNGGVQTFVRSSTSAYSGLMVHTDNTAVFGSGTNRAAQLSITNVTASNVSLQVRAHASQTGNNFEVTNSSGTAKARIDSNYLFRSDSMHNNAAANLGASESEVRSGTYTPTLTNVTNIAASTAYVCQWLRVGNVVTVSGKVDIDPTSAGATELGLSLPVASNFTSNEQCGGSFHGESGDDGWIKGDATNDRASFNGNHSSTANQTSWFHFSYVVL